MTTAEQLAEVQKAISAVMRNKSFTIDGKSVTRADLKDLETRETKLLRRLRRSSGRGGFASGRGCYGEG